MIQNVGLVQTSGVPPIGEGIAPILGMGGSGSAVVTQVGGWSGGPGAVRWYGGQWVMPYSATPGETLLNASCDVVPRADASALVELVSSNGQVLGSSTVPATTANIVIRSWPFVGTHTVADGEQVAMRVSPRDSTTGTWTSAAQNMTIIGCAVNATRIAATAIVAATINIPMNPGPARSDGPGLGFTSTNWGQNTAAGDDGVLFPVHGVPVGATITAVRVKLSDSMSAPATAVLLAKEMPGLAAPVWAIKGSSSSAGSGAIQLVQISPGYLVPAFTELDLVVHGASITPLRVYTAELDYQ